MIYGAIIGDIAGSEWEFHPCMKSRPKQIISDESFFTDDTVMTIAVADALIHKKDWAGTMREWALKYHNFKRGGYGGMFIHWLFDGYMGKPVMGPYGSFGNGSAMRTSAIGWACDTLEDTLKLAEEVSAVSHNHPEGIKGAQVTAGAIYLARNGKSKAEIKEFVESFGYDLSRTCDEIRPTYYHVETCQESIPETFTAFFESNSFEDCMELIISLGGDSDTMCAIAGGVAEAFYGIPDELINKCRQMLPDDMLAVVDEFEEVMK